MPTNYRLGGSNIAPVAGGVRQPQFAAATTAAVTGAPAGATPIRSRPTFQNQQPQQQSVATSIQTEADKNRQSNAQNLYMQQAAAQKKQQQEEAARQQESSLGSGGSYSMENYTYQNNATGARKQIIDSALSELGTPYAWGGGGYHNRGSRGVGKGTQNVVGVDCSGLTSYAYGTVGIHLPRTARQQGTVGYKTALKNLKPGDLVVWNNGSHVAMWLGDGRILESPNVGKHVRISTLAGRGPVTGIHIALPGE